MWLIGLGVLIPLVLTTVVAMGGRVEAATWGLVVAAGAMIFALRALYKMALALSQPVVEAVLEQENVAATAGMRELRRERRRVLRAINELHFDYEMGKLSDDDYRSVRQGYELRAVEVMRELDAEPTMHPGLEAELKRRGMLKDAAEGETEANEAKTDAAHADAPELMTCGECEEPNDGDARFCKHCGASFEKEANP